MIWWLEFEAYKVGTECDRAILTDILHGFLRFLQAIGGIDFKRAFS